MRLLFFTDGENSKEQGYRSSFGVTEGKYVSSIIKWHTRNQQRKIIYMTSVFIVVGFCFGFRGRLVFEDAVAFF